MRPHVCLNSQQKSTVLKLHGYTIVCIHRLHGHVPALNTASAMTRKGGYAWTWPPKMARNSPPAQCRLRRATGSKSFRMNYFILISIAPLRQAAEICTRRMASELQCGEFMVKCFSSGSRGFFNLSMDITLQILRNACVGIFV